MNVSMLLDLIQMKSSRERWKNEKEENDTLISFFDFLAVGDALSRRMEWCPSIRLTACFFFGRRLSGSELTRRCLLPLERGTWPKS